MMRASARRLHRLSGRAADVRTRTRTRQARWPGPAGRARAFGETIAPSRRPPWDQCSLAVQRLKTSVPFPDAARMGLRIVLCLLLVSLGLGAGAAQAAPVRTRQTAPRSAACSGRCAVAVRAARAWVQRLYIDESSATGYRAS